MALLVSARCSVRAAIVHTHHSRLCVPVEVRIRILLEEQRRLVLDL